MQNQYAHIGDEDVFNGQWLLAVFKIETYGDSLLDAATEVAAESSTGSNLRVASATNFSQSLDARVYKIDEENNLAYIAYNWRIFDRGGNVQNILTFLAGNVFGMGNLKGCKLLDVQIPSQMLVQYDGPGYTLDDMRDYLKNWHRPVFGTIIKPKIGLTSTEYAELCYDFWVGGGDFVKNDEPQSDQDFCPYEKMVDSIREAMDRAEDETGQTKVHSFNVSAADFDTMLKRAEYVHKVMKPGSISLLVDGITAGWTAVQTIRRHYPNTFLHFHRAGHGAFTREENPIGYTVPVLTQMARLAGASGIHTGTAGIGKMSAGTMHDDEIAVQMALRLKAKGHIHEQVWSEVPATDKNVVEAIKQEEEFWAGGPREMVKKRLESKTSRENIPGWRIINKMSPICSGGMNPVILPDFIDKVKTIDFIVTMGGGVHSHPMGTTAGVKAIFQGFDAWYNKVPMEEYAKDFEELKVAIDFYNVHGTQAQRIHGNDKPKTETTA